MPDTARGEKEAIYQVMSRGLKEITPETTSTIKDLIAAGSLYKGAEFGRNVDLFLELQRAYQASADREAFLWENLDHPYARFRNTAIGTLAVDLSEGVELERAVKSFETKVAPQNYKRPAALVTPKMIEQAVGTLKSLGLEGAVHRRYATLPDISVNNVLFVNREVQGQMKDGLTTLLMASAAKPKPMKLEDAPEITIEGLLQLQPTSIDLLVQNSHQSNFMSLTTSDDPARLFKWDNQFAWSYDGDVTDSIKEKVKRAGGNVTNAALRISLAWSNYDDLDIHADTPDGRIYYGNKDTVLDVDMNAGGGRSRQPVENLSWTAKRLRDGNYSVHVNQFSRRETIDVGFQLEIEHQGRIQQFSYDKPVNGNVYCVTFKIVRGVMQDLKVSDPNLVGGGIPQTKWGITTEQLVPVDTLLASPNHWDGQGVGAKHWFFILKDCKNPGEARGIYNEFLRSDLEAHRKVFELLGAKTKCPYSASQLSGVGFTAARNDAVTVIVNGNRPYRITF
jgi:hypothetical protein